MVAGILTERHEKTKTEKKHSATLQYTWHFFTNTCLHIFFRPKEPQNKTRRKKKERKKSIQIAILPFGENSHIIHGDMQRIMNTRGRVDHYNGFSQNIQLWSLQAGRTITTHQHWTLQRAEVGQDKRQSCSSSVPEDQLTTLSLAHTGNRKQNRSPQGHMSLRGESPHSSHATGFNSLCWDALHWWWKGPGRKEFAILAWIINYLSILLLFF